MNNDTVAGKFDQVKGQVKQSVGEAVGNQRLANSGAADQVKGAAKEAWGNTKDAANAVATDAHLRAEQHRAEAHVRGEQAAHNARESITNAAQGLKAKIDEHADKVKRDHARV